MGVSSVNILQFVVVIGLVILAAVYAARHVLRQFNTADQDFSESGGACSNCSANALARKAKRIEPSHRNSR
jgi:hypothetical protein